MAELGLLANLAAVIGVGVQTSIALYNLASTIGSAGRELEDMGSDINLFCRVLRQVQKSLTNPTSARLSMTAIEDTQDVVTRCHAILEDIKNSLEKINGGKQASIDVVGRVKWIFKRPKILMQRSSLQTCTTYLQLMLSTLDRASRISITKEISTHLDSQEEELDTRMTYNLLLVQQCANRRLEELEDEAASDVVPGNITDPGPNHGLTPPILEPHSPETSKTSTVKSNYIGTSNVATEKALPSLGSVNERRTSILINQRVFEVGEDSTAPNWTPTKGINLHRAAVRSDALLQRWTDRAHPKSPTAPEHANQTILESSESEPDRASYISWDSEPASLDMTNVELAKAKALLQEAIKEQRVLKEEARRAWEELGRREAEERQRATNLGREREELSLGEEGRQRAINFRSRVRTFVGGTKVVPAGRAKDPITNNVDNDTKLLSLDEVTRRVASDQQPSDKSMWVWDNTREEILKVEDQVRGELPTHNYASSATRAPESFQRQIGQPKSRDPNDSHIKVPKIHQTTSPRSRTEIFPEKRLTSDIPVSAEQTSAMASETQNVQMSGSNFPHAFERWETLSSHWEGLTSYWVRRLEENSDHLKEKPIAEQMGRQITDLSAAGANLFHAVVELQRLRASSERKFQRWFSETKLEQERARAERDERANALATAQRDRIKAENLVEEMRRNQLRFESGVSRESNLQGNLLWQPPEKTKHG